MYYYLQFLYWFVLCKVELNPLLGAVKIERVLWGKEDFGHTIFSNRGIWVINLGCWEDFYKVNLFSHLLTVFFFYNFYNPHHQEYIHYFLWKIIWRLAIIHWFCTTNSNCRIWNIIGFHRGCFKPQAKKSFEYYKIKKWLK